MTYSTFQGQLHVVNFLEFQNKIEMEIEKFKSYRWRHCTASEGCLHILFMKFFVILIISKKVNQSRSRPGVAQRVPGS